MSELKTFVFTDIVGSVELKRQMSGASDTDRDEAFVATILRPHRERIELGLTDSGGRVVSTAGDGHFLVFADTIRAARWAVAVEKSHAEQPIVSPRGDAVQVRMSLHVGVPQADPHDADNFVGKAVDYTSRLCDFASGGQVLVSRAALAILEDAALDGVAFHSHGRRDLAGIGPVEVHELVYDSHGPRELRKSAGQLEQREWTVLPSAMGATQYGGPGSSLMASAPPQTRIGNYELRELLGAGGMGNVYRARHTQFERARAIKIIRPQLIESGRRDIIRRFYQEIKAIGGLEHPNIVVAIDSSAPEDPTHYLVMEYVDGVGADQLVAQGGQLDMADACEIVRQSAVGLEYIHQQGMVHRDIKPSNLMITTVEAPLLTGVAQGAQREKSPVVKIMDLGLALLVGDDQQRLTQFGHGAMGTAMYMSPEQWKTATVDIRADIYSLGCTLYHLLAGRPPFQDSDLRPEKAHEKAPPPPIKATQPIPKKLWAVVRKMMAKHPDDRYSSPGEVAAALAPFCEGQKLAELVTKHRPLRNDDPTLPGASTETRATGASVTDTLGPLPPMPRPAPQWTPQRHTALWKKLLVPAALLVLVAFTTVFAVFSLQAHQRMLTSHRSNLANAADLAARQLASQINERLRTLERLAGQPELKAWMQAIDDNPTDEELWVPVQSWITGMKARNDDEFRAESWFITNAEGQQIARSPHSESVGQNYADRDYFHGRGDDFQFPEGEQPVAIQQPHISAVYRSTSTKELKVAFSVPIWNDRQSLDQRRVLGVLAMSVHLGEFRVWQDTNRLTPPLEVVLVDLREDHFGDGPRRGLILHHRELDRYAQADNPHRLGRTVMAVIDESLTQRDSSSRAGPQNLVDRMVDDYVDILGRDLTEFWGAFAPVIAGRPDAPIDTKWIVLVQEPMP